MSSDNITRQNPCWLLLVLTWSLFKGTDSANAWRFGRREGRLLMFDHRLGMRSEVRFFFDIFENKKEFGIRAESAQKKSYLMFFSGKLNENLYIRNKYFDSIGSMIDFLLNSKLHFRRRKINSAIIRISVKSTKSVSRAQMGRIQRPPHPIIKKK